MNVNLIRSQNDYQNYEPEARNEEDVPYDYQESEAPVYDNAQEPEIYEDDADGEAVNDANTENVNVEEEETEGMEMKAVSKTTRGAIKKSQTPVEVNLDQLVEKVRERLLGEDKRTVQLKQKLKKTRMVAQGGLRSGKHSAASNKKKGRVRSTEIEQHDLYEKTALHKSKKNKKDSYEDYVTPKKDDNALISVEEEEEEPNSPVTQGKVNKVRQQPVKKLKGARQGQRGQRIRGKRGQKVSGQGPGRQAPGQKRKIKRVLPRRKKKTTYVAPEYDDDTSPPTTPQLKVRTEIIGQIDYKDLSAESLAKLKEKDATALTKKAKIVTNMQTRAKFSFSSPNYYAKLPRIAEKYNFDEPIPQKDQEEEKLKEIVNDPDVLINKKIQVNPQPTLPIVS